MALISESDLRQKIKGRIPGVYVLFGEEDYLKSAALADLRKMALNGCDASLEQFNRTVLTDGEFSAASLFGAAASAPMLHDMRITEAELRFSAMKDGVWKEFISSLPDIGEYKTSVTVIKCPAASFDFGVLPKRPSSRLKELSAAANCVYFGPQPEYRLKKWLMRHFLSRDMKTDDAALDKMIELCGTDMYTLRGEVDKLCAFAAASGKNYVGDDMVDAVCCVNERDIAFELANAVSSGNKTAALLALKRCRDRREAPVAVMSSVIKTVSEMLFVSSFMSAGRSKREIADALKMHEYRVGLYMNSLSGVRPERLYSSLVRCRETDRLLKGSALGYEAIERFICTMTS